MSFWSGLARGFADADAKKEREAVRDEAEAARKEARDYSRGRDKIMDERYESQQEAAAAQAADAARRWQDTFDQNAEQIKLTRERNDRKDQLELDKLEIDRHEKLLKLVPPGVVSGLGGGSAKAGGANGSSTVMSPEAMKVGAVAFQVEFKNLDEDVQNSEFFKAASQSPAAKATLMAFVQAQAKKGNRINLEDLPKYFKYLGATEGKGEAETTELMKSLVSGEADLKDPDAFIKALGVLSNYKPTQQLFMQVDTPGTIDDASKQLPVWENAVEVDAYRALPKLEGDDKKMVQRALALLETKANRTQGLDILAKFGYGANAVEEYSMGDNPVIRSYYGDSVPTRQSTAVAPQEATVTSAVSEGATTFADWGEVEKARGEGFSGVAVVGGTPYSIAPQGAPEGEAAPVVETPAEAFHGTERIEPKVDTAIDAMFNKATGLNESAVEPTTVKRTPKVEETPDVDLEEGVETISSTPDSFESPEDLEKSVDFVLEEIEDLGIVFPTTTIELAEFRDDLKELVYEMGADIPEPVLTEVVRRATENAKGGLSVTGTLQEAGR
jgi:hypothetical protein